jgi:hypothetical protein
MKAPRNLWPLGVILAFVLFAAGTASLIVLACTRKADLVSDDYYEQELHYQTRIDSLDRAKRLPSPAAVNYDSNSHRLTIRLPADHPGSKPTGQIQLYRPSAVSLDRSYPLAPDTNGFQSLDLSGLPNGLWKTRLLWTVDDKEYCLDGRIVIGPGLNSSP